jgi:hypothetical protein
MDHAYLILIYCSIEAIYRAWSIDEAVVLMRRPKCFTMVMV